jgi:polyhydroxybutyrate depolymerase
MRRLTALVALALLMAACSSSSTHTASSSTSTTVTHVAPSTSCNRPHTPGQTTQTFTDQGKTRTYELYVPKGYDGRTNVPLLLDFHGFGSNAKQQMAYSNFAPIADREHFLIVAPDGQGAVRHFNLTGERGLANDITMVGALLDRVEAALCVDTTRVYSTGMSDGGAITSLLACQMADRIAAFAPVAVIISLPRCPAVPIVGFAGTADPVVPYNGGRVNCCGNPSLPGAVSAMNTWAADAGCAPAYTDTKLSSQVVRRTWSGCKAPGEPVFYTIVGGGHTWPGAPIKITNLGLTTDQINASGTIWKFVASHRLQ